MSYFDTVLVKQLGHFTNEDGRLILVHSLGEVDARLVAFKVGVFTLDKGILFLEAKASKYGYSYMNGEWYYGSQQTRGCRTPVKMTYGGPMEEALRAKRNFEKKVADANLSVLLEDCRVDSAVWFISATRAELEQMPLPSEIDKRLFLTEESLVEIV